VKLPNTGDEVVDGWQLGWWFEAGQQVEAAVGATLTQDGALVTATNAPWNGRIKPGRSQTFVLLGSTGGAGNVAPQVFTVGGEVCTTR
jgi:hypothetical protein